MKIVCIGQNYKAHADEMDLKVRKEPVIFLKAQSSLTANGSVISFPGEGRVDYEGELAVIISRKAKNVKAADALEYVESLAAFNDVTARDMQDEARAAGLPWALSKSVDTFAPMSDPVPIAYVPDLSELKIETRVNGVLKQKGSVSDMIFSVSELIEYITKYITLEAGDIIATGTPVGVGSLEDGDEVEVKIENVGTLKNKFHRSMK